MQKGYSQAKGWDQLSDIKIEKKYNEFLGFEMDIPIFSPAVQKLEGSTITLEGFIIPTAGYKSHSEFIFSALPYNLCYFCGGAGPETVMEVKASKPIEYTAEKIVLRGKLHLNADDPNRLMFILTEAIQP
ncbi:hypothetical protein GCM10025777_23940 [Membranihabitans marinus]